MFTKKPKNDNSELEKVINKHLLAMQDNEDPTGFAKDVATLSMLMTLKDSNTPERVDANTRAIIAANIAGILLIVSYEHAHVVTSKALNFVQKLR